MINHPTYQRGNIYLSGGMQFADDIGLGWRETCATELQSLEYYPIDIAQLDREYAKEHGELWRDLQACDLLEFKANIRRHFIRTDLKLIVDDCDAMVVFWNESTGRGAGTHAECQTAYDHGIPIFIVNGYNDDEEWFKQIPAWIIALSTRIFADFNELYTYMAELPAGILKRDVYGNHHAGDYYLCSLSGEPFHKSKTHFVSQVTPLYSLESVDIVKQTYEDRVDRYEFFTEYLKQVEKE